MRSTTIEQYEPSMDLTPMIDVIFIMVIFWMAVANFADPADQPDIATPFVTNPESASHEPDLLVVNLLADGMVIVRDHDPRPLSQLGDMLQWAGVPEHILLRADVQLDCTILQQATAVLRSAGANRIAIAARPSQS